ncbi:MAG: peptidylprolyl isomerase [Clostridia bacterium]
MRKRVILALMLVVALAATTSCSLVVKDAEVDKQTVIIEAAGKTFTKGEVKAQLAQALDYQEYMYQMYGMAFDKTDKKVIADSQENVLNGLVEQAVIEQKKTEMNMNTFTDAEIADMQATVDKNNQQAIENVKMSYFADTKLTGEELDKAVADKMTELTYPTSEQLLENEKLTKAGEKLKAEVVKDVAVSDDEVKAQYDKLVADATAKYETNPGAYGTDAQNGGEVYYVPAGYRYVKNILIKLLDADTTKINELSAQMSEKQTQLSNIETAMADLGTDAAADDEATAKTRAEQTTAKDQLNTEIAELQKQLDAAKEAGYTAIQPKVDEVLAKLTAGEDFDAVMKEFGEDPGMQNAPTMDTGYLVCEKSTNWVAEFTQASMALKAVGEASPAVRTSMGVHFIKYQSDAASGAVAFDTVKDTVKSDLLLTMQDDRYNETVAQWVKDANAKIYRDRLAD